MRQEGAQRTPPWALRHTMPDGQPGRRRKTKGGKAESARGGKRVRRKLERRASRHRKNEELRGEQKRGNRSNKR